MEIFFVEKDKIKNNEIIIDDSDYNHIVNVLRYKKDDIINVRDGFGLEYKCNIFEIKNSKLILKIIDTKEIKSEPNKKITLYQGMPKKDKLEYIVQKSVELGVYKIVPVNFSRSIPIIDNKKNEKINTRLNSISLSASKQSGRGIVPEVSKLISFNEAIELSKKEDIVLVPNETEQTSMENTRKVIKDLLNYNNIGVFIGPEGGFEKKELDMLSNINSKSITLGKRILRTETASLAVLSMMLYELED